VLAAAFALTEGPWSVKPVKVLRSIDSPTRSQKRAATSVSGAAKESSDAPPPPRAIRRERWTRGGFKKARHGSIDSSSRRTDKILCEYAEVAIADKVARLLRAPFTLFFGGACLSLLLASCWQGSNSQSERLPIEGDCLWGGGDGVMMGVVRCEF
jgi:hypothetical protein